MAEKRVGWLAGFLSRKKENWGFLSFKTLGNKFLASSSLSSFALFPGLGVVVAGMAPRRPPPTTPAAVARGFFSRTLAFLLLFSRFVVTSRTLLHTLLTQSSFFKSGTQHTWEFVFSTVSWKEISPYIVENKKKKKSSRRTINRLANFFRRLSFFFSSKRKPPSRASTISLRALLLLLLLGVWKPLWVEMRSPLLWHQSVVFFFFLSSIPAIIRLIVNCIPGWKKRAKSINKN
jgi:hypothetical protein